MKIEKIGVIPLGVEGSDEYLLINTDEACIPAKVKRDLLERYYKDTTQEAGGYYCHRVTVMEHPYQENEFVGVVHHRYDV